MSWEETRGWARSKAGEGVYKHPGSPFLECAVHNVILISFETIGFTCEHCNEPQILRRAHHTTVLDHKDP